MVLKSFTCTFNHLSKTFTVSRLNDAYREKLQEQFNIQEQLNRILAASD